MDIGFHCSHEQFPPSRLLRLVASAEEAGFTTAMCSDHFYPWSDDQGQSGYAWSWLGAALHATRFPMGLVTAPGQRYHPAIVAQAAATLAEMFPGRLWMALGSGQFLNESITGECWPPKAVRNERLRDAADVIRALWAGETVSENGLFNVEQAHLYTRPSDPPPLFGAALTPETAGWMGGWADGLITVHQQPEKLRAVVDAFREGGGGRKPMHLQVQLSYAPKEEEALRGAWEQWRAAIFESPVQTQLRSPEQMKAAAQYVRPEDMRDHVLISADLPRFVDWIREIQEMGFSAAYLHNVNTDQERFVDAFGRDVLPQFARKAVR